MSEDNQNKLPWWAEMFNQEKLKQSQQNIDALRAFEILKAYCKNRECNKDCLFYRELRAVNNIEQFCGLCEIVMSDDKEAKKNE